MAVLMHNDGVDTANEVQTELLVEEENNLTGSLGNTKQNGGVL